MASLFAILLFSLPKRSSQVWILHSNISKLVYYWSVFTLFDAWQSFMRPILHNQKKYCRNDSTNCCTLYNPLVRASHPVREVKSTRDENEKQPRMETLQVLIIIWFIHRCNDSDHEYFKSFGLLPVIIVTNRNKQWEQGNYIQLSKEALFIIRINRLLCTELALIFDNSSRVTCVQYSGCMYNLYITERFYSQASLQMVPRNYMYIQDDLKFMLLYPINNHNLSWKFFYIMFF